MIKAVIWDMDGVMVDSEVLWGEMEQVFFPRHGIDYHDEFKQYVMGKIQPQVAAFYKEQFNLPQSVEDIIDERVTLLKDIYRKKLQPNPGLHEAVAYCQREILKMAVASSSPRSLIEFVLNTIGLHDAFPVITSGDEVERGKPEPDIFILTAKKLEVAPSECMVIEDSQNGLSAAKAAGMYCVVMPDPRFSKLEQFTAADAVVQDLTGIPSVIAQFMYAQKAVH